MSEVNDWFLGLEEVHQKILREDKWMLAESVWKAATEKQKQKELDYQDRKDVLLKATLDILEKCDNSPFVENVLTTTAVWDEATCDGHCLMDDIIGVLDQQG